MSAMNHPPLLSRYSDARYECGCDEAGRGCLAGPVVAAAVILPEGFACSELNDSKQLSERERERLRPFIEREALAWAVAEVDNREIDELNILQASILAMHRAIDRLAIRPDFIIVDGNHHREGRCPLPLHRGGFGAGQDAPRRADAPPARRIPALWVGLEQGLSHRRPPPGHRPLRHDPLPPPDVPPTAAPLTSWNSVIPEILFRAYGILFPQARNFSSGITKIWSRAGDKLLLHGQWIS